MYALSGYINGNTIVVDENLSSFEGYNVIVTVLDSLKERSDGNRATEYKKEAARSLAGLWSSHGNTASVDQTVRTLREGRRFDT